MLDLARRVGIRRHRKGDRDKVVDAGVRIVWAQGIGHI